MIRTTVFILLSLFLTACAETSVQPLTQTSFKISTESECGAKGTREIAFQAAAIEVIKRGEDRFVIVGDQTGSKVTGGQFSPFGGFQTYSNDMQDMTVDSVKRGDPRFANALSARQTLGAGWEAIVEKGVPTICTPAL